MDRTLKVMGQIFRPLPYTEVWLALLYLELTIALRADIESSCHNELKWLQQELPPVIEKQKTTFIERDPWIISHVIL